MCLSMSIQRHFPVSFAVALGFCLVGKCPMYPCGLLSYVLEDSALKDWGGWAFWPNREAAASVRVERGWGNRSCNFD